MTQLTTVLKSMRLPFLILTPVCVFLGVSTVIAGGGQVNFLLALLALFGALSAHIGVNTLNEYSDFKSGLDLKTTRTQFSGGSGSLPQSPNMAKAVLFVGIVSVFFTLTIGSFFIWKQGVEIVPIGIVGLLLVATYTNWINHYPLLCLISPGLGFGFLIVAGTQFALEGVYSPLAWLVAAVPFFLINNLLLLNQYPDIVADKSVGRNHFPIAYGISASNTVYGVFVVATVTIIISYVLAGYLPLLSLVALLPMPFALFSLYGAIKHRDAIGGEPHYLGSNVAVAILTPLLLAISLCLS